MVSERIQSLESSLSSQQQVQDSVQSCKDWLASMHDQINAADCPIGPSSEHAQTSLEQFEVRVRLLLFTVFFLEFPHFPMNVCFFFFIVLSSCFNDEDCCLCL